MFLGESIIRVSQNLTYQIEILRCVNLRAAQAVIAPDQVLPKDLLQSGLVGVVAELYMELDFRRIRSEPGKLEPSVHVSQVALHQGSVQGVLRRHRQTFVNRRRGIVQGCLVLHEIVTDAVETDA